MKTHHSRPCFAWRAPAHASACLAILIALSMTACNQQPTIGPADAEAAAAHFLQSLAAHPAGGESACGLSGEQIYGRSAQLPFAAGEAVVEAVRDGEWRVVIPYWCSGETPEHSTMRVSRSMAASLKVLDGKLAVASLDLSAPEPLSFWRQFLPLVLIVVFAPLIVYVALVYFWARFVAETGGMYGSTLLAAASLKLSDLPPWSLIGLRLATLGLAGWAGAVYFGGWAAILLSVVGFLIIARFTEIVFLSLTLALVRVATQLVLGVIWIAWLPGLAAAIGVGLIVNGYAGWAIVTGIAAIIVGGWMIAAEVDVPATNTGGGILVGIGILIAGLIARH